VFKINGEAKGYVEGVVDIGEVRISCIEEGRVSSHVRIERWRYVRISMAAVLEMPYEKRS
jgi:hypothetical protein